MRRMQPVTPKNDVCHAECSKDEENDTMGTKPAPNSEFGAGLEEPKID